METVMISEINYLGKHYKSETPFPLISQEEHSEIKEMWYKKPNKEEVLYEMAGLRHGSIKMPLITKYYFRRLMDNTVVYRCKWSINEVMQSREVLSMFVDRIKNNKKVFDSDNICDNIDTAFRLGGSSVAKKVAQFPLATVDYILEKYNINNNWYDYSCGWGARLAGALKNRVNYYGTDPNYLLVDKLAEFDQDYKNTQMKGMKPTSTHIKCQGSEKFVPEWENTIGLAFSSPPYFLLEDYKIGEQSYKEGVSYQMWLDNYMLPTFKNIHKYLIDEGFFIVNIKDFGGYTLEKDTIDCAEKAGFYLKTIETLKNSARPASIGGGKYKIVDVDENIYVFCKKGFNPCTKTPEVVSIFDFL